MVYAGIAQGKAIYLLKTCIIMTNMEAQFDQDTLKKIDLINKKIEEINQRRMGCHTTKIEDELDRQELNEYINSLKLTDEQKKIIDKYNKNSQQYMVEKSSIDFIIMSIVVIVQVYIAFVIYDLMNMQKLDTLQMIYLLVLVVLFTFNMVQILRYLRIWK